MWRHVLNDLAYQRRIRRAIGREVREIMAHDGELCEDEEVLSVRPPCPPREVRRVKRQSVWRRIMRKLEELLYI